MSLWLKKAIIIISLKINITSANLRIGQSIFFIYGAHAYLISNLFNINNFITIKNQLKLDVTIF